MPDKAKLAVATLAALPYAIGVGGTTLSGDAPLAPETVYNENIAAGGGPAAGCPSWCMPGYQHKTAIPGLLSKYSKKKAACPGGFSPYARQVPDLAADEDPYTGYVVRYEGAWSGGYGGAGAAEAVIAAVAASIDASPFCSAYGAHDPGLLPQALYALVAASPYSVYRPSQDQEPEIFGDIISGNNDYTPSGYAGGRYPATTGYDLATGLGYPLVSGLAGKNSGPIGHPASSAFYPGLAAGLCATLGRHPGVPVVTGVTPDACPAASGSPSRCTAGASCPSPRRHGQGVPQPDQVLHPARALPVVDDLHGHPPRAERAHGQRADKRGGHLLQR